MHSQSLQAFRCQALSFEDDPGLTSTEMSVRYWEDALLVIDQGKIETIDHYEALAPTLNASNIVINERFRNHLVVPGFIDTHIHFPQMEMIGVYGAQLLEWLENYTFPTEAKFANTEYATKMAELFISTLIEMGTTTAMVFASVHAEATDALFAAAYQQGMRLIAGKVMMDRNAPAALLDTPDSSYADSARLIEKWHGKGRLSYSVTPRFAPTSTPQQLQKAGELLQRYPDVYLQTHLSENLDEIAWVKNLFPEHNSYLEVYDHYGLVQERSVFAHGIYLTDSEIEILHKAQASLAFCPSSNLFLGSGLFPWHRVRTGCCPVKVGLGSDIGAGTRFNALENLHDAYKVTMLGRHQEPNQKPLTAFEAFYLVTLGGARALGLDSSIGKIKAGYEADLVALNWAPTRLQALRQEISRQTNAQHSLEERLFGLMMLGDDRNIAATWINGRLHSKL